MSEQGSSFRAPSGRSIPNLLVSLIAASALAACVPEPGPGAPDAPPSANPATQPKAVFHGVRRYASSQSLWKVCDEGRAIYALESGYKQGSGIAVVENAAECTKIGA